MFFLLRKFLVDTCRSDLGNLIKKKEGISYLEKKATVMLLGINVLILY